MFVEQCSSLVPLLANCAAEAEHQRRVPAPVIERAHELGLFSAVVPTSLGGRGEDLTALANGTRTMAHGSVSSAWTLSFSCSMPGSYRDFPPRRTTNRSRSRSRRPARTNRSRANRSTANRSSANQRPAVSA